MRATVRHFHSPDVEDGNLDAFNPADCEDLGVLVQMMVGPIDDELAHESFDSWFVPRRGWPGGYESMGPRWVGIT